MLTQFNKQRIRRLKAQALIEYSVIFVSIIAALIAMQIYVKRGISGRLKESSDAIGEQYAPENITTNITTVQSVDQTITSEAVQFEDRVDEYGFPIHGIKQTIDFHETTTRSGSEELGEFEDTLFE